MSEWDTDIAVVSDEDEARAIGQRLTAAGISHLISRQPPTEGPFHVKVQAKDLLHSQADAVVCRKGAPRARFDLLARLGDIT